MQTKYGESYNFKIGKNLKDGVTVVSTDRLTNGLFSGKVSDMASLH